MYSREGRGGGGGVETDFVTYPNSAKPLSIISKIHAICSIRHLGGRDFGQWVIDISLTPNISSYKVNKRTIKKGIVYGFPRTDI